MKPSARLVEPFYFAGSDLGCLLLHGFTGSPSEMRYLGEKLAADGWTVSGIVFSGHGTTPEVLARTRWENWVRDAQAGIEELRLHCSRVVAIGLSMGGLLSLDLAEKRLVDAAIALNAPMVSQDWRACLVGLAKPFVHYVEKVEVPSSRMSGVDERSAYDRIPLAALASLNKAIRQVRRELGRVLCPVLIMQSTRDKTVSPYSAHLLVRGLSAVEPQLIFWANSGHILTLGSEREAVAREISRFLVSIQERS